MVAAIAASVQKTCSDPAKAVELLGAIQNEGVLARIDEARKLGRVVLDSQPLQHPAFADARVRTPLIVALDVADEATYTREWFGPITFVIAVDSSAQAFALAGRTAARHGALTLSAYTTSAEGEAQALDAALEGRVALSLNLTGGVFVNQSAAYSDYHGTGGNPAANASLADAAFVANRFRVVQSRHHVAARSEAGGA